MTGTNRYITSSRQAQKTIAFNAFKERLKQAIAHQKEQGQTVKYVEINHAQ